MNIVILGSIGCRVDGINNNDYCGHSVSLSGNGSILAIGEPGYDVASGTPWSGDDGRVRVYKKVSITMEALI